MMPRDHVRHRLMHKAATDTWAPPLPEAGAVGLVVFACKRGVGGEAARHRISGAVIFANMAYSMKRRCGPARRNAPA